MTRSSAAGRGRLALAVLALTSLTILCTLLVAGTPASQADGHTYLSRTVAIPDAADRSCAQPRSGKGVQRLRMASPALDDASYTRIEARLSGPEGSDWDLAVLDADSGRVVAGSAFRGAEEIASGY